MGFRRKAAVRKPAVAVIAESCELRASVLRSLRGSGLFELEHDGKPDLICLGCADRFPATAFDAACKLTGSATSIPMVLITFRGSEELAVQALTHGIKAYLKTPFSCEELQALAVSFRAPSRRSLPANSSCLVGQSQAIRAIAAYLQRVAKTASNVLITGETGTGKELIAKLIHKNSPRAEKPMVCINCAAIPDTLLESELFGYERGAFTGAHVSQDGKLKIADGGTLFLDEIGDMSPYAQAKLLRVLESREIQRLGSNKAQPVDFRVIAATNYELDSPVKEDKFRRDLFFRLNVARIHLPPLRERKEDILPLAHFFREEYNRKFSLETNSFSPRAEEVLLAHDWPGNVRELRNTIEAAFINIEPGVTAVNMPVPFCEVLERKHQMGIGELERIMLALSETQWNKSKAAEKLHWSRMTLYRKMTRYRISSSGVPLFKCS